MAYSVTIRKTVDAVSEDLVLYVKSILPRLERVGDDATNVAGEPKNSRFGWLSLEVEFAPFLHDMTYSGSDYNTIDKYLKLKRMLMTVGAELKIQATTFVYPDGSGGNWFTIKLPMIVDTPNDESINENYEQAMTEYSAKFKSKSKVSL